LPPFGPLHLQREAILGSGPPMLALVQPLRVPGEQDEHDGKSADYRDQSSRD
jgi:hypothetical protein